MWLGLERNVVVTIPYKPQALKPETHNPFSFLRFKEAYPSSEKIYKEARAARAYRRSGQGLLRGAAVCMFYLMLSRPGKEGFIDRSFLFTDGAEQLERGSIAWSRKLMEVVYEATGEKLKIPFRRIHLTDEDAQSMCGDLLSSEGCDFGSTSRCVASGILRYRSGLVFN